MSEETILQAAVSFVAHHDGVTRHVRRGETFRVGHPLIDGREVHFEPFEVDNEWDEPKPAKQEPAKPAPKPEPVKAEAPAAKADES